jgi:hypothetical protein
VTAADLASGALSTDDFAALDLAGRAFRAREGRIQFRGRVRATAVEGEYVVVHVERAERREREEWAPVADFDYRGRRDVTAIFREPNGDISLQIMYVGSLTILAERA